MKAVQFRNRPTEYILRVSLYPAVVCLREPTCEYMQWKLIFSPVCFKPGINLAILLAVYMIAMSLLQNIIQYD